MTSVNPIIPTIFKYARKLTVVFCVNPYDRHQLKEHFGFGLREFHVPLVPASTFQIQAVHVDTLCGRGRNVVLHPLGDFVAKHHVVQSPAFVGPSYLLLRARTKAKDEIRNWRFRLNINSITVMKNYPQVKGSRTVFKVFKVKKIEDSLRTNIRVSN